jgi:hypothetical protein
MRHQLKIWSISSGVRGPEISPAEELGSYTLGPEISMRYQLKIWSISSGVTDLKISMKLKYRSYKLRDNLAVRVL